MSKKNTVPGFSYVQTVAGVEEYILKKNNLRVLYFNKADTGVVTTNITYLVGSRDEARGETGLAHMLEHMFFKPTTFDIKAGIDSASMQFERETGCILNANTWCDRTTYFFSYPTKFLDTALRIEAERMTNVVLTNESLSPEKNNVLSEFDMNNGDPNFALSVQMVNAAFLSHPYGHETIGFREDIEDYTAEKLEVFYRNYYRPDNAVMMVIGDVDRKTALTAVKKQFSNIENPGTPIPRFSIREPKQEGIRRVTIDRPTASNILTLGFKHAGFPSKDWFTTGILCDVLGGTPESVLQKLLVDTGKAANVSAMIGPTSETSLGMITVTLAQKSDTEEIEHLILSTLKSITAPAIKKLVEKSKTSMITSELFTRDHSLKIAQELTEYVASGKWEAYGKTLDILNSISVNDVIKCLRETFVDTNMVIGNVKKQEK